MSLATVSFNRSAPLAGTGMGWLHSARFDIAFIFATAALALISGVLVSLAPRLLWPILLADLWLLGYHHVIATWTRLGFDRAAVRQHGALIFALPPVIVVATATLGWIGGLGAIGTLYFYWQWFHYTRQSWGILRAYGRKRDTSAPPSPCGGRLFTMFFYGMPLWGVLRRVAEAPESFLGLSFYAPPLPVAAADAVGAFALAAGIVWLGGIWRGRRPHLSPAELFYLVSHLAVFAVGYVVLSDITQGWLVVNIWHNAQYILFVWLFNRRRFERAPTKSALSWFSQPGRVAPYLTASVAISSVVYLAIDTALAGFTVWAIPAALVAFQAINFHHYIVDGIIWKGPARRPPEDAAVAR